MKIELLFPELSTVYGDAGNALYLKKTCKDAQFIETHLQDKPHFVSGNVDMIYLGSMTEKSQIFAINALKPYVSRIKELIENGVVFLCTGSDLVTVAYQHHMYTLVFKGICCQTGASDRFQRGEIAAECV